MPYGTRKIGDTNAVRVEAASATREASGAAEELRLLKVRFDRLTLANQALWEIIAEKLGVTDEELRERMAAIDTRDGIVDGKITLNSVDCPACHRKTPARQNKCMYCGVEIPGPVFGQLG